MSQAYQIVESLAQTQCLAASRELPYAVVIGLHQPRGSAVLLEIDHEPLRDAIAEAQGGRCSFACSLGTDAGSVIRYNLPAGSCYVYSRLDDSVQRVFGACPPVQLNAHRLNVYDASARGRVSEEIASLLSFPAADARKPSMSRPFDPVLQVVTLEHLMVPTAASS